MPESVAKPQLELSEPQAQALDHSQALDSITTADDCPAVDGMASKRLKQLEDRTHWHADDLDVDLRPTEDDPSFLSEGRPWVMWDLERWRKAFQEEARRSVHALRQAMDEAGIMHIASQFAEWRKADAAELEQLRGYVQELLRLNCSLRQCNLDQLSPDGLAKLTNSVRTIGQSVDDLVSKLFNQDLSTELATAAQHAATKALASFQVEARANSDALRQHFEDQRSCWDKNERRWNQLMGRLDQMQKRVGNIEQARLESGGWQQARRRTTLFASSPAATGRTPEDSQNVLTVEAVEQLSELLRGDIAETVAETVLGVLGREDAASAPHAANGGTGHLQRALSAVMESSEDCRGSALFSSIHSEAVMAKLEIVSNDVQMMRSRMDWYCSELQDKVLKQQKSHAEKGGSLDQLALVSQRLDRLDGLCMTTQSEISHWRQSATNELGSIRSIVKEDLVEMVKNTASMGEHRIMTAAADTLQHIKDIQLRGNIKVDLNNGDVAILKSMDFVPRRVNEKPDAQFVDILAVDLVLRDLADLGKIFEVPMVIEGHTRGSSSDFWEQLAINRAKLVMNSLESKGIKRALMSAVGLPGKKGVNKACVIIRFDIFPNTD